MNDPSDPSVALDEELIAYLDGELDTDARLRIDQRLADDDAFRTRVQQLQQAWDWLDALPRAGGSDDFTQSTLEMVTLQAVDEARRGKSPASHRRSKRWFAAGGAVLAAGFLGYAVVATIQQRSHRQLLRDLPVIENVDLYRHIDSLEFVRALEQEGLFEEEGDHAI